MQTYYENLAPDSDTIVVRNEDGHYTTTVTVWRDEHGDVHVCIEHGNGGSVDMVLGQEGSTEKL